MDFWDAGGSHQSEHALSKFLVKKRMSSNVSCVEPDASKSNDFYLVLFVRIKRDPPVDVQATK